MTVFGALMDKLWALTPMCNFEQPEVLCSSEELFYRRLWALFNNDMTTLVDGRTIQGENK